MSNGRVSRVKTCEVPMQILPVEGILQECDVKINQKTCIYYI